MTDTNTRLLELQNKVQALLADLEVIAGIADSNSVLGGSLSTKLNRIYRLATEAK